MKILILRQSADDFFDSAVEVEKTHPDGEWRYFKFISKSKVLGIYESETGDIKTHKDFFKYFYGQFKPVAKTDFNVTQCESFESFCLKLNDFLINQVEILDLSVDGLWIWTHEESQLKLSPKLKEFLQT